MTKKEQKIRQAIADLLYASGCISCCGDEKAHEEAQKTLGTMLAVPMYKDGSGFDFSPFRTPPNSK